jgi:pentatricopeptide repeat protein
MWHVDRVGSLLSEMRSRGIEPELVHYIPYLKAVCDQGMMARARTLFDEIDMKFKLDVVAYSTMIHGACKLEDKKTAEEFLKYMLDEGLTPDAVTYSMLINMFAKSGDLEAANGVLNQMTASGFVPDVAVFDSLIQGYGAKGETEKVLELIREMLAKDIALDSKIVSTILSSLGASNEGQALLQRLPGFDTEIAKGDVIPPRDVVNMLHKLGTELDPPAGC